MNANPELAAGPGGETNIAGRLPAWVVCLFALDVALIVAPVVDFLVGSPYAVIRNWLHLDSELSLPAWYSSMKWLGAAALFALIPIHLWRQRPPGMWMLAGLGFACLVFSIDEILGVHEWLGRQSDAILPGGTRTGTPFERTGIWPFLLGIPVVATLAVLIGSARHLFGPAHRAACMRLIVGFVIMFTGALLVELGKNLIALELDTSGFALLQLAVEELLEMLGVTVIIWSAYELAHGHGFRLLLPASHPGVDGAGGKRAR